jgi:hypothetical protein
MAIAAVVIAPVQFIQDKFILFKVTANKTTKKSNR